MDSHGDTGRNCSSARSEIEQRIYSGSIIQADIDVIRNVAPSGCRGGLSPLFTMVAAVALAAEILLLRHDRAPAYCWSDVSVLC